MNIDIQFIPFAPKPETISERVIIVMDILRATSVIVHAMAQGALEIFPVSTVEEAFQLIKTFPPGTTLLGGEKDTRRIKGFNMGNSPKEYIAEKVKDKRVILRTTNGTKAFRLVSSGKEIMVGSFFNIGAVAQRCLEIDRDLLLFPSGDEGNFSLEDTVCGGMFIDLILKKGRKDAILTDASHAAHILYKKFENNLLDSFYLSNHGNKLIHLGLRDDLLYCTQTNITNIVPIFRDGVIRVPLTPSLSPSRLCHK